MLSDDVTPSFPIIGIETRSNKVNINLTSSYLQYGRFHVKFYLLQVDKHNLEAHRIPKVVYWKSNFGV